MTDSHRGEHDHIVPHQGKPEELAARLAPPEEGDQMAAVRPSGNGGLMVVGSEGLKLPRDFTDEAGGKKEFLGLGGVALAILIFSLAFIAFIAFLIWSQPPAD